MTGPGSPPVLRALTGETLPRPPVWFMRQAGRFLPEYRALRATTPDFISFCLDPAKAAEATMQPLQRFDLDAAIVFADILLIPKALGQAVWFEPGEGPRLGDLPPPERLAEQVEQVAARLQSVGATLALVRARLGPEQALIGFAGGPWTVLTYMIEGKSSDRVRARALAYADPDRVRRYLDVLVDATAAYLALQVSMGAQVLQVFESWAEGLSEPLFEQLITAPHQRLLQRLTDLSVSVPVIGFPRGAGALVERYAQDVEIQGVGLDTQADRALGLRVQKRRTIQGALDPLLLRCGGDALRRRVDQLLAAWSEGPYIFNLGHGMLPDTPIAHVQAVVDQVKRGRGD